MSIKDSEIATVLEGLFNSFKALAKQDYDQVKDSLKDIDISDPSSFYFSFTYLVNNVIEVLVSEDADHVNKLAFLYQNFEYVDAHFGRIIESCEGSACCADKSGTIVRALDAFFKTGREINFNYDQEYTYHLPKRILKTHDDILEYFDAIRSLYYGRPEKYLNQQVKIANILKEEV